MKVIRNSKLLIDRKNWLGAAFLDLVNEIVLRFKFRRIEVYGRENVPAGDPFILVSNHSSRFDGLMVLRALRRKANYMVSPAELSGYQGVTLPWVGAFPANPKADLIGFAQTGFRKGDGLVVFPEGTVYYDGILHSFKPGAARIALSAHREGIPVKVIPASIMYEWEAPAVARIIFGEPVDLSAYSAHFEKKPLVAARNLSDSLYREVAELRSEISARPSIAYLGGEKPCRTWVQQYEQEIDQAFEKIA